MKNSNVDDQMLQRAERIAAVLLLSMPSTLASAVSAVVESQRYNPRLLAQAEANLDQEIIDLGFRTEVVTDLIKDLVNRPTSFAALVGAMQVNHPYFLAEEYGPPPCLGKAMAQWVVELLQENLSQSVWTEKQRAYSED